MLPFTIPASPIGTLTGDAVANTTVVYRARAALVASSSRFQTERKRPVRELPLQLAHLATLWLYLCGGTSARGRPLIAGHALVEEVAGRSASVINPLVETHGHVAGLRLNNRQRRGEPPPRPPADGPRVPPTGVRVNASPDTPHDRTGVSAPTTPAGKPPRAPTRCRRSRVHVVVQTFAIDAPENGTRYWLRRVPRRNHNGVLRLASVRQILNALAMALLAHGESICIARGGLTLSFSLLMRAFVVIIVVAQPPAGWRSPMISSRWPRQSGRCDHRHDVRQRLIHRLTAL